jgi:hypothetical protein
MQIINEAEKSAKTHDKDLFIEPPGVDSFRPETTVETLTVSDSFCRSHEEFKAGF